MERGLGQITYLSGGPRKTQMPKKVKEESEQWETGICWCCCTHCSECCLAEICPCVVYAQNLAQMKQKGIHSDIPVCDENGVVPGVVYCCALNSAVIGYMYLGWYVGSCSGIALCMQCVTRGNIRRAYHIEDNCGCCSDLCCSSSCTSCALVQEAQQLKQAVPEFADSLKNSML